MLDRLEQLIKQSARLKNNLAVIYLDLDNFKEVNDSRGHDFGDEILKAVSLRLRSKVRDTDTVARIGGDEFVILLGQIDRPEKVDMVVQEIIQSMTDPFPVNNQMMYLTVSLGVSIFPEDGQEGKVLLLNADQAMYAAKSKGKNGSHYFTSAMQIKANLRANMISELRVAIEKKQFKLEYQPIIDLQTGAITHAEALLRWHRPDGEIVPPSEFIDIAEESGLILPIGNWIIKEVLLFLRMQGIDQAPAISINVAVSQFSSTDRSIIEWVDWIREAGVAPHKIIFEITERMMLTQSQRVMSKIAVLQKAGCQFSLDDFGTGYSSIVLLKNFNFDYLKIDSHFIATLATESVDASLVSAMISMAKGLGLASIAEGVETERQAAILRGMGCQYVQGHLFSKPLTPEELRKKYFQ
jgi:diguanylate cyclase (GGDEF)-like protein